MYSHPQIVDSLSLSQRKRLACIDFRLYFLGEVWQSDISNTFGIARAQAARDFALYQQIAPHNIEFIRSHKGYRIGKQFTPLFVHAPQSLLSILTQDSGYEQTSEPITFLHSQSPVVFNSGKMDRLATISRAIHVKRSSKARHHKPRKMLLLCAISALLLGTFITPAMANGGRGGGAGGAGGVSSVGVGQDGSANTGVSGGAGGGGSGSRGGRGGSSGAVGGSGGATPGAAGQVGGNGSGTIGGGGGGGGAHGTTITGNLLNSISYTGGNGGAGGIGGNGSAVSSGGGGAGGFGIGVNAAGITVNTSAANIRGGNGGNGGLSNGPPLSHAGFGGGGGTGIAFSGSGTLINNSIIRGGNGGNSGAALEAANFRGHGRGGDGVAGSNLVIRNSNTIAGGNGGWISGGPFAPGEGGIGINGANLTVVNSGAISAGLDGISRRANAIVFTSGINVLELHAGSSITGNVVASGSDDTLRLGGAIDSVFNVSAIGASTQYQGFERFEKTDTSTWTLNGTTAAVTPWTILGGTLSISNSQSLGGNAGTLTIRNGTTLEITAPMTLSRNIVLSTIGGGIIDVDTASASNVLVIDGQISGTHLTKTGIGTMQINHDTNIGLTTVVQGMLALGNGGTDGWITGNMELENSGVLAFNRADNVTFAGLIDGDGSVRQIGSGITTLTGNNTYTGGTSIEAGSLLLGNGGNSGMLVGDVFLASGSSFGFNRTDSLNFTNIITGNGELLQLGSGTTILNGDSSAFSGNTSISGGSLRVDGILGNGSNTVVVSSGAGLQGSGTVAGDVTVANGGILSPGAGTDGAGTLHIGGNLSLNNNSQLNYNLGQAGVVNGPYNDLVTVGGNLVLDGTLNVATAPNGRSSPGVYRIFNYAGSLTNNGLALGTGLNSIDYSILTRVAGEVDLVNTSGLTFNYWNPDQNSAILNGGSGVWQGATGNTNWTDTNGVANGRFTSGSFAIFAGTGGTVTVDNSQGTVIIEGMQFLSSGYRVEGQDLTLASDINIIRVGDGTIDSAGTNAIIANNLIGNGGVDKEDFGTLVLTGTNTYSGGTIITDGILQLGDGTNTGSITGNVTNDATFAFNNPNSIFSGIISGHGDVHQMSGTLVLTASNNYTGATTIDNGSTLQLGNGTIAGAITGSSAINNNGTLAFNNPGSTTFNRVISGTGSVHQMGGTTILNVSNDYSGVTTIDNGGILQLGYGGVAGAITGTSSINNSGTLAFNNPGTTIFDRTISGSGTVHQMSGTTVLSGDSSSFSGNTAITGGSLRVDGIFGNSSNTVAVSSGAALQGSGVVGGNVTVANAGILSPGTGTDGVGTLHIGGNLVLNDASQLNYNLGQAGVTGGAYNDLVTVGGDLVLDGVLNVATAPGGTFGPGVYRIFSYAGSLTNNGLALGTGLNSTDHSILTRVAGEVDLVNTTGLTLNYWNPSQSLGTLSGGSGIWQGDLGNMNWTDTDGIAIGRFASGSFAVFAGTGGVVTLDNSQGTVTSGGMQFLSDGYTITGEDLTLANGINIIRVGDGTRASTGTSAIIDSNLVGSGGIDKQDSGTLILTGSNIYSGGTIITDGILQLGDGTNAGSITGNVTNDATLAFNNPNSIFSGIISGHGDVHQMNGTLVFTASNNYTGATIIDNGSTLQLGNGTIAGAITGSSTINNSGTLAFNNPGTTTFNRMISGSGDVHQISGTTVLTASNDYTGATNIDNGSTLQLGNGSIAGAITGSSIINNSGTLAFNNPGITTFNRLISGSGDVHQMSGTTILTASNVYTGATNIDNGSTLQLGNGSIAGAITGTSNINNSGTLAFNNPGTTTFDRMISGSGGLHQMGGTTVITADNVYSGLTTIDNGSTLQLGNGTASGSINNSSGIRNDGTLVFNNSSTTSFGGVISGSGVIEQRTGTLVLSGNSANFTGNTQVNGGILQVDGIFGASGTLNVNTGAILSGTGTIGGHVNVGGGTLSAGAGNGIDTVGHFAVNGNLSLDAASTVNFDFGEAGVVGGLLNDLVDVAGNLNLNGTLNVNVSPSGYFGAGLYRIFNYSGSLTNNGLIIGTEPVPGETHLLTAIDHEVDLVNTAGLDMTYWDGGNTTLHDNSHIDGGSGTWSLAATNRAWTNDTGLVNNRYTNPSFAIFAGQAGVVTVDNTAGQVSSEGMQFAVDGYRIQGGNIELVAGNHILRVGDGTATGADYTATIAAPFTGSGAVEKYDLGTLILTGVNTYSGGTTISGGTLQLGDGTTAGSITGDVITNANLAFYNPGITTFGGTITGSGAVHQIGGTTVLTANNDYHGGTYIRAGGTLQLGEGSTGGASGWITGDVVNEGELVFNRSDSASYDGIISGSGRVTQQGIGTTTLTGANTYTGGTLISHGTLQLGDTTTVGSLTGIITNNAILAFNNPGTTTVNNVISGNGRIEQRYGTTVLSSNSANFNGDTYINNGSILQVEGTLGSSSSALTVNTGGTLSGSGTLGGNVNVGSGTLSAGAGNGIDSIGHLHINGNLNLASNSILNFDFGQAGVIGGINNDWVTVGGNLVLDGTLNATTASGGTFGPGIYRIFSYSGALTNNGLALGMGLNSADHSILTRVAGEVDLVNTSGLTLNYWNPDGSIAALNGGSGMWQGSTGNNNWTDTNLTANGRFTSGSFAIFAGTGGTVTVDNTQGTVTIGGMQFLTDGYRIEGEDLTLASGENIIRVGDGTAARAGMKATIDSNLVGSGGIDKEDFGTLVLTGTNTYTGETKITDGVLQLGDGANAGSISNTSGISINSSGTLAFNNPGTTTFDRAISGTGALHQMRGTLILTNDNTGYTGATTIDGTSKLQLGDGNTSGWIAGSVSNSGTLSFNRSDANTFAGIISGNGSVEQQGSGNTTLTGANTYTGNTTVINGSLTISGAGSLNAAGIVNIGTNASFRVQAITANGGNYTFANRLTGNGLLSVALNTASNAFSFSPDTGSSFAGTLALGVSSFNLAGDNTTALSNSTLQLNTGNLTTVGAGNQSIGNLHLNGGALSFANLPTGQITTTGLTLTGGQVRINPGSAVDTSGSLLMQDEGVRKLLINASSITGTAGNLDLTDLSGALLNSSDQDIVQNGRTVARGAYGYNLSNTASALFLNANLFRIALLSGETLTLSGDAATPAGANDMSALITGTGNLNIAATNRIILDNSGNDYTGTTSVSSGVLALGSDNALGQTSQLNIAATASTDLNGHTQSVGSLAGSGNLMMANGALTVANGGAFSGVISGSSGHLNLNSGTLVLTGENTYTGNTNVNLAATLQLGAGSTVGRYIGNINNQGEVVFDNTGVDVTYAGLISGNGGLTKQGHNTLILSGANSYTGFTEVASGTLKLTGTGSISLTSAVNIDGGATFRIENTTANAGNYLFFNPLNGSGVLSVDLISSSNFFAFDSTAGSAFAGTVDLGRSTFNLAGHNTNALSQATLVSDIGNTTIVGSGQQQIFGFKFNGGTAYFDAANPPQSTIANTIIETTGLLDVSQHGTAQVDIPAGFTTTPPPVDINLSLLEQDDQNVQLKLIQANGQVVGGAGDIKLIDGNGDKITHETTMNITNTLGGTKVAEGHYDYRLSTSINNDGLYINYGLVKLELIGKAGDATILSPRASVTGPAADLSALITGSGDLAIVTQPGDYVSLSNLDNDYTGATTVHSGNLKLANDHVLGNTSSLNIAAGGAVDIAGHTQSVGALNTVAGSQLLLDGNLNITNAQRTAGDTVGGGIDVNTLYGSGDLHVAASILYVNQIQSGFNGNVILDGGATLFLNTAKGFNAEGLHLSHAEDTLIFGSEGQFNAAWTSIPRGNQGIPLSGIGNVSVQDGSDVNFIADNSNFSGRFIIDSSSVLRVSRAINLGSAAIDNAGSAVLTANSDWVLTNAVTGNGIVIKDGSAILRADQSLAAFSGTTQIKTGTLAFGDTTPAGGGIIGGNVMVEHSAVLAGHGRITGALNNAGTVRLSGGPGAVLTVNGNYMSNGGSLYLNTVLGDSSSVTDRLVAGSVSLGPDGATRLYVSNVGGLGALTTGNGIEVVHVNGGAGASAADAFVLGDHVKAGAYEYSLYQNGVGSADGNWYLRSANNSPVGPSDPYRPEVPVYMASSALASQLGLAMLGTWDERSDSYAAAKTLSSSEVDHNQLLWIRLFGESGDVSFGGAGVFSHVNAFKKHGPSYDYDLSGLQAGVDVYRGENANGAENIAGVYMGVGRASATVDRAGGSRAGDVDMDNYSMGAYWTHKNPLGWYVDTVAQATRYSDISASSIDRQTLTTKGWGFIGSVEAGYPILLDNGWTVTPQAQLIYQHVSLDNGRDHYGSVDYESSNAVYARIGGKLGNDWKTQQGHHMSAFVRANIWHDFGAQGTTTFNTLNGQNPVVLKTDLGGTQGQIGFGLSGQISPNVSLYGGVDYNFAIDQGKGSSLSGRVGVNISW